MSERTSTHHVNRGQESLPCYCAATIDHLIGEEAGDGEALARRFHEAYERLAPSFGYETRTETRQFDPSTPNGRLMIAVCSELSVERALSSPRQEGDSTAASTQGEVIVGWMNEDELPEGYPYDAMFRYSKVDMVRMFPVFAPCTAAVTEALVQFADEIDRQARECPTVDWRPNAHENARRLRALLTSPTTGADGESMMGRGG